MPPSTRRLDLLGAIVLAAMVGLMVWAIERSRPPIVAGLLEIGGLEEKYGPGRHSEHAEEWIIRDFFQDRRGGVFVDVGASDYMRFSNTYYLETALGWSGIAVEPQQTYEAGYAANRPRTKFRAFFASDRSDARATLYVQPENPRVTSADRAFNERAGSDTREFTAPTITLSDLLDSENVPAFDFLSMDIELSEPRALAGFDVDRFRPALVCIEAHPEVRQQILDYFADHRYTIVGKYLRADPENLYFMPRR